MSKIFNFCLCVFCSVVVIVCGGVAVSLVILYLLSSSLPDHNFLKNYSPDIATRVFLRDGSKLCEYAKEKRYFVPIDCIPDRLANAFIAVEDKHFYQHYGIDFVGIARSVLKNINKMIAGKRPQGASTITQQVARIFLIKSNELSYVRKLKEAILSFRIESTLNKRQILELYLNQIYLGCGTYGVAAAAKIYFDKTLDELTLAECAYLASLAKGANNYHPVKHKTRALIRRNWAIRRQLEDGYITKEQADQAIAEDLQMTSVDEHFEECGYYSEEVRKYLIENLDLKSLNTAGLIVRGTLDTQMQKCAYHALRNGLEKTDRNFGWRGPLQNIDINCSSKELCSVLKTISKPKGGEAFSRAVVLSTKNKQVKVLTENGNCGSVLDADVEWAKNLKVGNVVLLAKAKSEESHQVFKLKQVPQVQGAIVVIENETGRILAMQGGYSFEQSEFNRVIQAERQVGSVFKPFVFLAGLENGFAPNTIVDASPVEIDLGHNLGKWKPRNYNGRILGKMTFRQAIERSVNTATVRIAQEVGLEKISKIAKQFGVFDNMPHYFSYVLGAGETTLLKLATAYAMFANGGMRITPTVVDYVQDRYGKVIYTVASRRAEEGVPWDSKYPPMLRDDREQILNEQSIYQLTSLLEGVMTRGSGAKAACLNIPVAGKTGTSNDSRDAWFIGYTLDITVGVFVGFDDNTKTLGKRACGSNTALPIFIDFMNNIKPFISPKPFRVPNGIHQRKIDATTGIGTSKTTKTTLLEAFKDEDDFKDMIEKENNTGNNNQSIVGVY